MPLPDWSGDEGGCSIAPVIDSHCHLDAERFDADREAVIARAFEAGLTGIVIPGVGPDNWEPILEYPKRDARLQVGLGIHPQMIPHLDEAKDGEVLEQLDALLGRKEAIAVGECGLDGPSVAAGAPIERQVKILRAHFALARRHGLPLLVHVHRVQPAMIEFLEEEPLPEAGVLMHSYSGGVELMKFYAAKGCYFSFAGPVTWHEARKPIEALKAVPLDRLLVETDAPDQSPQPYRGKRSEPGYLPLIVEGMARAFGLPTEELARRTTENAGRLFPGSFRTT